MSPECYTICWQTEFKFFFFQNLSFKKLSKAVALLTEEQQGGQLD